MRTVPITLRHVIQHAPRLSTPQQRLFRKLTAILTTSAGVPRFSRHDTALILIRSYEIAHEARTPEQIAEAESWYLPRHSIILRADYRIQAGASEE